MENGNVNLNHQSEGLERLTLTTESALVDRLELTLNRRESGRRSPNKILLHEFGGLQGRADLVDASIRALPTAINIDVLASSLASPAKARLLSVLTNGSPRTRDYLERVTGFSQWSLNDNVRQLETAGLVKVDGNSTVSLGCPLPWTMIEIVAYECKLSNWRRALHQAIGYRSFSQSVWIVMPESGAQHAAKLEPVFQTNGIGLMSVDNNGRTHIFFRAGKLRPSSRRLYLMAVGIILKKYVEERRRLHSRLRPESIQCI